jgi:23S rRNA pseudouridine1911/1915/1917 synthase
VREPFPNATLVEVSLLTGRTHQIRVHFAHIGHPVVGDPVYGPKRDAWGMTRQALHAYRLAFAHPRTGERVEVEAPLPPDLAAAIERLRRGDAAALIRP